MEDDILALLDAGCELQIIGSGSDYQVSLSRYDPFEMHITVHHEELDHAVELVYDVFMYGRKSGELHDEIESLKRMLNVNHP